MPVTKSAKKTLRKEVKWRRENLVHKNEIKKLKKQIQVLLAQGKTKEAKELLPKFYKIVDKAAKANTIKKNTASRKKSRMTKMINSKK